MRAGLPAGRGRHFQRARGEAPIFLLDDFAAELDQRHQRRLLEALHRDEWQVLMTGTEPPAQLATAEFAGFHVERGCVRTDREVVYSASQTQ